MHGEAIELAGFERVDRGLYLLQRSGCHRRLERQRLPQGVPFGEDPEQGSQSFAGGTRQVLEQGDLGLEKGAGDQLSAQALMAPVTVAAQQNITEQVRLPDVAVKHERVSARARQPRPGPRPAPTCRTPAALPGRRVAPPAERESQSRCRVVLADQHPSQRRPQLDEGGRELRGSTIRGGWSHCGGMLLVSRFPEEPGRNLGC